MNKRKAHSHFLGAWLAVLLLLIGAMLPAVDVAHGSSSPAAHPFTAPAGQVVEVKFKDGLAIRLRAGRLVDLNGHALDDPEAITLLARVASGTWMRSHAVSEVRLEALRADARRRSGKPMPDLNLYFRLRLPFQLDAAEIVRALRRLDAVEAAYHVPVPAPAPLAPDYSIPPEPYQDYLDAAPNGIDARYAWSMPDGRGAGVAICDAEYSVNTSHADLEPFTMLDDQSASPFGPDHGTAVIGVLGSSDNGWGTTGIAHQAALFFSPTYTAADGWDIAAALTTCAAALQPGDVILIEQQTTGPNGGSFYVPAEWYKPTYDTIVVLVAAGITVVEAAGNGGQNLDDPIYSTNNDAHHPFLPGQDSGAIIVGAGRSPIAGPNTRARSISSNYGTTVDVQGWSDSVVTTGYGDLYSNEGEHFWFTSGFSGTSSASAIVAGAAAVVQGTYRSRYGMAATPAFVKALLRATGTPQQGDDNIGPLPNLRCALDSLITLDLAAPASLFAGAPGRFTAIAGPAAAAQPITYTWQATGQAPLTYTLGLTNTVDFTWDIVGSQTITVTATSGCGMPVVLMKTVTVAGQPVVSAALDGPSALVSGSPGNFSVTAGPLHTARPITYTWQATTHTPISSTGGLTSTATFAWDTPGSQEVAVTLTNHWGAPVTVRRTVLVTPRDVLLAFVLR